MIGLSKSNLYDYFSTASSKDSATAAGKKLFDFIDRESKTLVITIGDSWTWGADLTQKKIAGAHLDRLVDDSYRIENVYGNVLAKKLNADFLNLGEPGSGNWHIDRKLKELSRIQDQLNYKNIIVIGIFTDTGRDFNSHCDIEVNYRSWLLEHIKHHTDYYNFLKFINSQISQSIFDVIADFDQRYQWVFSTNFVDPIGFDILQPWILDRTWLQVICDKKQIAYRPKKCYMVFPWVIEKLESVFDMAPELDRTEWLEWINDITRDANLRAKVCFRDNINFGPLLHPSASNHACWAEYLYEKITNE